MGRRLLAAVVTGLHILLGVVPGAARIVEDGGQQDAGDGRYHQEGSDRLDRGVVGRVERFHAQTYDERHDDRQHAGQDHGLEGALGGDVHAQGVVRLLGACEDPGLLPELPPDLVDHVIGGLAHRADGKGGEQEHQHRSDEGGHEHWRVGQVHDEHLFQGLAREQRDLIEIGGEQQERGEGG